MRPKPTRSIIRLTAAALVAAAMTAGAAEADLQPGIDALGAGRYDDAIAFFEPLAKEGNRSAQILLGNAFAQAERFIDAYTWLHLAANCGSVDAAAERDALARKMSPSARAKGKERGDSDTFTYCR